LWSDAAKYNWRGESCRRIAGGQRNKPRRSFAQVIQLKIMGSATTVGRNDRRKKFEKGRVAGKKTKKKGVGKKNHLAPPGESIPPDSRLGGCVGKLLGQSEGMLLGRMYS